MIDEEKCESKGIFFTKIDKNYSWLFVDAWPYNIRSCRSF